MRRPRLTASALLALATLATVATLAAACGDTGATGPDNAAESTIVASVSADGASLSGVTVQLFAEAGTTVLETVTTDAAGEAAFRDLIAGTYDVEITVPTGYDLAGGSARRTVTVARAQQATVSFSLTAQAATARQR